MLRVHQVGVAALAFALVANVAAAQAVNQTSTRDSLWNGTLIGLGAGVGSAAALEAVFCENGFGACDFPWAAYVTLGGIGAGAGAGIDFLIGRNSDQRKNALRLSPIVGRARKGVRASLLLPQRGSLPAPLNAQERAPGGRRDSIWNGTLIGAGVGAAGGAVWGLTTCGSNDSECFAIAGPVGIIGGAGIGVAVGAIADALHD
jgi:hypothetical protein